MCVLLSPSSAWQLWENLRQERVMNYLNLEAEKYCKKISL